MKLRIKVITLDVSDPEKPLAFYRDSQGLPQGIIGTEFESGAVVFFDPHPSGSIIVPSQ